MLRFLVTALAATVTTAQTLSPPAGWPQFTYKGVVTDKNTLKYNPTDEFIFPSVLHAGQHLDNPLGEWYLYYAPHENPGGISLMYADNLNGPWIEYAHNPIIKNKTPDYSVPHVSSPDAAWNFETKSIFLYFHGDNTETRWAEDISGQGTNFRYGGVAVNNAMVSTEATETSYARVFEHPDPDSSYRYGMFFMSNEKDDRRKIRMAESADGKTWDVAPGYTVYPGEEEGKNVSGPDLWKWKGKRYIIYHASSGNCYARTIDKTLRKVGETPILLYKPTEGGRAAAPQIKTVGGESYLFFESGDRLGATIAWAKTGY
jgi:hypothetical protein